MFSFESIFLGIAAGLVAWSVNCLLLRHKVSLLTVDAPNARSMHTLPTPRGGGLGIAAAVFILGGGWLTFAGSGWMAIVLLIPTAAIAFVSHIDDRRSLPPLPRFVVHIAAAGGFCFAGHTLNSVTLPGLEISLATGLGVAVTAGILIWFTNLYNFMDGMDGLAAGMGVIGFGSLGLVSAMTGDESGAVLCWIVCGASVGFLLLNFPPARLFMGDIGSSMLGFLAAAIIISSEVRGGFPVWIGLLVFGPFVVDATLTLLRRLLAGKRIWEAHSQHYYQRAARLGLGHRRIVLIEYALMVASGACATFAIRLDTLGQVVLIGGWAVTYVGVMEMIRYLERNRPKVHDRRSAHEGRT